MRTAISLLVALPFVSAPAFGWGCEGHQVVALIARAHLTSAASEAVDRLLRENPIDPSQDRYCSYRPDDLMAMAAAWADTVKSAEKTSEWHYIDIPVPGHTGQAHEKDATTWCRPSAGGGPGCIVSAIEAEWTVLRDSNRPAAERARALRYVIHLVGDLSQPLHVSDNHDQGGNCTEIRFFSDEKPASLHGIWDYGLIARELKAGKTIPQYAVALDRTFAENWPSWGESKADIFAWAWDSHALASAIYADLKPPIPITTVAGEADRNACDAGRTTVRAQGISVGDEYAGQAFPVIHRQLAKAGYHLAGLFNQTFR
jgi:hypothetical protein